MKKKILALVIASTILVGGLAAGLIISTKVLNKEETSGTVIDVKEPDLENCTLLSQAIPFDGEKHSLQVSNLPTSCHAEYSEQNFVLPGKYPVTATVFFDGATPPKKMKELSATLTIREEENTKTALTPKLKEIEFDDSSVKLSSSELLVNVLLDDVYLPGDLTFSIEYGNSQNVEYTSTFSHIKEKEFLFTLSTTRLESSITNFVLKSISSPTLGVSANINRSLEIVLPNEFDYSWSESDSEIFLTIKNDYLQNPINANLKIDGVNQSFPLRENKKEYNLSINKSKKSGIHELSLESISFISFNRQTSLDFENTNYKYATPEGPEEFFGENVLISDIENYAFDGDANFAFYIEKKSGKTLEIENLKFSSQFGDFTVDVYKNQLVILEDVIFYKAFARTTEFYGGEDITFNSLIADGKEYPISFSTKIGEKDFVLTSSCSSIFNYETNKTTLSIFTGTLPNGLIIENVRINSETLNYAETLSFDGFIQDFEVKSFYCKDNKNRTYTYNQNNVVCSSSSSNKITSLEILNDDGASEGIESNLIFRTDKKIVAEEIVSISVNFHSTTTKIETGFVQISDYEIEVPYVVSYYEGTYELAITEFVYSNENQFTIQYPCAKLLTGFPAVQITGYEISDYVDEITGSRKFSLSFLKETQEIEIKYVVATMTVDGSNYYGQKLYAIHDEEHENVEFFSFSVPIGFNDSSTLSFEIEQIGYSIGGNTKEKTISGYEIIYQ